MDRRDGARATTPSWPTRPWRSTATRPSSATCSAAPSGARRIVEAGTSFGVSTLYLAAAVRDNGGGVVFGAEYEPAKVERARANFEAAGLASFIDLREGDIVEATKTFEGPIDFVLFDIWGMSCARCSTSCCRACAPARSSARTTRRAAGLATPRCSSFWMIPPLFRTMTLPFEGGFELTVKL